MANYSGTGLDLPFTAASDMDSYQYRFVKIDTSTGTYAGAVNLATGGSNPVPIGVLQNDPRAGTAANVRIAGVTKVFISSSTAIQNGNLLMSGSAGEAEIVDANASAFSGVALEAITAGSGYISMLLRPYVSKISGTT